MNKPICQVNKYGNKRWFLNEELHREDGPAVEYSNGYKAWYLYGKRHREDGPAIIQADGTKEWWLNGEFIEKTEFDSAWGPKNWDELVKLAQVKQIMDE
jgi:hypothetical protein